MSIRSGKSPAAAALLAGLLLAAPALGQPALPQFKPAASYRIEAVLDPASKVISGQQTVYWTNQTSRPTAELWFHLYLNAFKNNRSTFARESGGSLWDVSGEPPDDYWGFTDIEDMQPEPGPGLSEVGILSAEHVSPDDGNPDDETVLRVQLAEPVAPGVSIAFKIRFRSKLPRGIARTGWVDDYFFAAQWFPKVGVLREDGWNCHQYHAHTEYFADFGGYDVEVKVPTGYVVAGTGSSGFRDNEDGTTSYRFEQDRVHDHAWVASPRFRQRKIRFSESGLPTLDIQLYLLPEHESLGNRHLSAVRHALRLFGQWFGPYPYSRFSLVDPAFNSDTGGMEYPTLVTAGTSFWSPPESLSPEAVTIHEVAHQWWYGMVANNEFEEAWLDEGLASWSESRALKQSYPPAFYVERFLGGIPVVFRSMPEPFETASLSAVRRLGKLAAMNTPSWTLQDGGSYAVNAYSKPEVTLWTLERLLGEETMLQAVRLYFQRHAFSHPTTEDFIAAVNDASGRDWNWFFEETFSSSELVDYAVHSARSARIPPIQGRAPDSWNEDEGGAEESEPPETFLTEVVVRRVEGARMPVDVLMVFEDGSQIREEWDGQDRFKHFKFERPSRLRYAAVDPDRKILLDVDPVNNSRLASGAGDSPSPAAAKWSSKWLFWLQNLLETFAFLG